MVDTTCKADGCDRPVGRDGGRGMCKKCLKRWRETLLALGLELPPAAPKPKKPRKQRVTPPRPSRAQPLGYEIEDWPADQHYGLAVDGICSAPWGCDKPIGSKGGRGLCPTHLKAWAAAYARKGVPKPKRTQRDPHCKLPSDEQMVLAMREHRSYVKTAVALGVSEGSLRDFLRIRPELKQRMQAEWRPVFKPQKFTQEQRQQRAREQGRASRRKRRFVPQQRIEFGGVTEQDARDVVDYSVILENDPCSYCGSPSDGKMQVDHVVPLVKGGDVRFFNLTSACKSCNSSKGVRDLLSFMLAKVDA